MFIYPELLSITADQSVEQIKMLSECLHEYGKSLRKHFRIDPRLMFINQETIENIKNYFMKHFSMSQTEVLNFIKAVPEILFFDIEDLDEKIKVYYPSCFIKRDIKEILIKCPEFILLDSNQVLDKINNIKTIFNVNFKKACEIVRKEPNILFYKSVENKLCEFLKYNISKDYILNYPILFTIPDIAIPIKFILTRVLGLDKDFYKVVSFDTSLLLSRLIYMLNANSYEYQDLLLAESEFCDKYKTTKDVLSRIYRPTKVTLQNLIDEYVRRKDNISNWSDILIPDLVSIESYLQSKFNLQKSFIIDQNKFMPERLKSLNEFASMINLTKDESLLIIEKRKNYALYARGDVKVISELFKKYGLTNEDIAWLLFNKPTVFSYPAVDLEEIINEIKEYEACEDKEAIMKYL